MRPCAGDGPDRDRAAENSSIFIWGRLLRDEEAGSFFTKEEEEEGAGRASKAAEAAADVKLTWEGWLGRLYTVVGGNGGGGVAFGLGDEL